MLRVRIVTFQSRVRIVHPHNMYCKVPCVYFTLCSVQNTLYVQEVLFIFIQGVAIWKWTYSRNSKIAKTWHEANSVTNPVVDYECDVFRLNWYETSWIYGKVVNTSKQSSGSVSRSESSGSVSELSVNSSSSSSSTSSYGTTWKQGSHCATLSYCMSRK